MKSTPKLGTATYNGFDGKDYIADVVKVKNNVAVLLYIATAPNGRDLGITAYVDRRDWARIHQN